MRIHFERSGGLLGRQIMGTVDMEALPQEEANDIRQMLDDAQFFELPATMEGNTAVRDQFQYRLQVEDEEKSHTVATTDTAAPDALRPLLRRLTVLVRSQGRPPQE